MTKSRARKFSVSLLAGSLLLGSGMTTPAAAEAERAECAAPVCSEVQQGSGWFDVAGGECVLDLHAALKDLKEGSYEDQKLLAAKSVEELVSEAKASKQANQASGLTFDMCIGPPIIEGACGASCSDCMCCVYCQGKSRCVSWPTKNVTALTRMTAK